MFEPKGYPAAIADWETFEIFGQKALFSNYRVDRATIPESLYAYDLRDDGRSGDPCSLEDRVVVNHMGTVVVKKPIKGTDDGVEIGYDDYNFVGGYMDIEDFAAWKGSETEDWPEGEE